MTCACQLTEISASDFPKLHQLYQYFPEKYPFLLATTSQPAIKLNSPSSAYDILFIEPEQCLQLDSELNLTSSGQVELADNYDFLNAFDCWFSSEQSMVKDATDILTADHNLPFTGGWFVFFAYELAQQIEPCLKLPLEHQELPIAYAARVKKALILDHAQNKLFFVSESGVEHQQAYEKLLKDCEKIALSSELVPSLKSDVSQQALFSELFSSLQEEDDQSFLDSVAVVKNYIKEGDVFQVNLSRLWRSQLLRNESSDESHSLLATWLYEHLSLANPAPFSGLVSFKSGHGCASIISSSPERLLKIKNNYLESRPIAGTRPRSLFEAEDMRLMDELHDHPKEQAEHIMLIDLIRNDLGRVCQPGTVKVNELMVNESYAHVHHIVSNVIGKKQSDKTPSDAIRALFPGGTITGCPKVRCMEIVAELEQHPRGAYTGSMGYINLDGSMDLNILIRTMVLEQSKLTRDEKHNDSAAVKQILKFRAGAGLVYDSVAKKELQETRAKAKGLLKALQREVS